MTTVKNKIKLFSLAAMLLASAVSTASAAQTPKNVDVYYVPLQFVFDGEQYAPPEDQQGFIYEGSTYVPLRFISYSLNKAVQWDGDTYKVTVEEPKAADKVQIDEYNLNTKVRGGKLRDSFDASQLKPSSISVYQEKVQYVFDGQTKEIGEELPGLFVDNSLYVPLRFFSESVGRKIEWDAVSYTIKAEVPAADKPKAEQDKPATPKPAEAPKPAAPAAPVMGGGGGGGATTTRTEQSIADEFKPRIEALQSEAMVYFLGLLAQYSGIEDEQEKAAKKAELRTQAEAKLAEFDSRFNTIISAMEAKLGEYQYGTAKADEYRASYEQAKSLAKQSYGI
ncbi:copper amine oxidase N-terminal domain-containing protein [Paenibacillus sp.]|uniref:copper amine oxidase N-terminal domain-containing protein n=1 Tax=Paenibacillus sp. TaxID=58172 RepID=UPI00356AD701